MKKINSYILYFCWRLLIWMPSKIRSSLVSLLAKHLNSSNFKRNKYAISNLKQCFPDLDKNTLQNLYTKNLYSLYSALSHTGIAWFWSDKKIDANFNYRIHNLNLLKQDSGVLLIFKHSHHLELDTRILGMHAEIYGVERRHNSDEMQQLQEKGRLKGVKGLADKNKPLTFIRWLKNKKIVLYAIDQDYGSENATEVLFFNTKCSTTNAPIKILKSTQCKVLFLNSFFKDDELVLSIEEINNLKSESVLQDLTYHIETKIREHPEEYLWQHRRFKSTLGKKYFYG